MKICRSIGMLSLFVLLSLSSAPAVASIVTWTSGRIVLPDGTYAQAGDVQGYAFITTRPEILLASLYDMIHEGISGDSGNAYVVSSGYRFRIDFFIERGTSDANGEINLDASGLDAVGPYNNQWAKVYYTCIHDGYEYYMEIDGNHYQTASVPDMKYQNLASYGTWQQGYAVPEPTAAPLMLVGIAVLALRRRLLV